MNDARGAESADGQVSRTRGRGVLSFSLWGCLHADERVRLMHALPGVMLWVARSCGSTSS